MNSKWMRPALLMTATAWFAVTMVRAGGFELPNQGAAGAGQAEAFAAQADDPSAIYYNPAGIAQLQGTEVSAGIYALFPKFRFDADNGPSEEMTLPSELPQFYAVSDLGTENWRFGFGTDVAFGLNLDWGDHRPLSTIVSKAKLEVLNFAPTVAYRFNDHLFAGVALNVYYGDVDISRDAVLAPPPVPTGDFRVRGTDWAVGATPGVMWKINDRNTLAAVYRSPFSMDFDGSARVNSTVIPEIGPYKSHLKIDFPQIIGAAYAFYPTKRWKLETDVVWTDWHVLRQVPLTSVNPQFNQTLPAHWMSGFSYRLGTQYDLDEHWALRAGYAFGQASSPGSTFTPLVPDANYHLLTAGIGYRTARWSLDAAYQFAFRENRHIENAAASPLVNGTWENQIHTIMLMLTFKL
jgi:long-chain fatty acid transport protein